MSSTPDSTQSTDKADPPQAQGGGNGRSQGDGLRPDTPPAAVTPPVGPTSAERVARLRDLKAKATLGGGERRIQQQHAKGKLTARERVDLLMDEGTFEEIDMFVTHRISDF